MRRIQVVQQHEHEIVSVADRAVEQGNAEVISQILSVSRLSLAALAVADGDVLTFDGLGLRPPRPRSVDEGGRVSRAK